MLTILSAIAFAILGYLSGSLTPSIWITRLLKGVDVRDGGSGHATTTNTIRQAGFGPGAIVLILDIAKGFLPTWLALRYAPAEWIIPLTAGLAVVGHCWPLFAGFRGGMGLATAGGGLLAVHPPRRARQRGRRDFIVLGNVALRPARNGHLDWNCSGAGDRRPFPDRLEPPISRTVAG